jgi:NAD(P)-dependent dehydrogenase (short-subunit alcohol dehydrogenase family)
MSTYVQPFHAVVVGASGGIGAALTRRLLADPRVTRVTALSRSALNLSDPKLHCGNVEVTDESSIAAAVAGLDAVHLALVATGTLHEDGRLQPEKSWRSLQFEPLSRAYAVNAIGPALVAKHVLPLFPRASAASAITGSAAGMPTAHRRRR